MFAKAEEDLAQWQIDLEAKRKRREELASSARSVLREELNTERLARAEREGRPLDEVELVPPSPDLASHSFAFNRFEPSAAAARAKSHEQRAAASIYSFDDLRNRAPAAKTPTASGGRSLASFMGSSARGPVLTRNRDATNEYGDVNRSKPEASFLAKNPALLAGGQRRGVPLPGMVKETVDNAELARPSRVRSKPDLSTEPPPSARAFVAGEKSEPSEFGVVRSSPLGGVPPQRAATLPAAASEQSKQPTASLTRLQSASIVRQRLNAAEERSKPPPAVVASPMTGSSAVLGPMAETRQVRADRPPASTDSYPSAASSKSAGGTVDAGRAAIPSPAGSLARPKSQPVNSANRPAGRGTFEHLLAEPQTSRARGAASFDVFVCSAERVEALSGAERHVLCIQEVALILARFDGASARLWQWSSRGGGAEISAAARGKQAELQRSHGIRAEQCVAGQEPPELLHAFGGRLVTRLGQRKDFDGKRTALYRLQCQSGMTLIDEVDVDPANVSSAHCYVLVAGVARALAVWTGRGSTSSEQQASAAFAKELVAATRWPVESAREQDGRRGLFWRTLGVDAAFADANHWRFRSAQTPSPRFLTLTGPVAGLKADHATIVDLYFEIYIVVPPGVALGDEVRAAEYLVQHGGRPFPTPVHVLELPSLIPLDLATAVRGEQLTSQGREMRLQTLQ